MTPNEMMSIVDSTVANWAALIVIALLGIGFGLQKVLKYWKEGDASTDVVSILHRELNRMGEQNSKLLTELTTLQLQVVELQKQISALSSENNKLRREVQELTSEIHILHQKP